MADCAPEEELATTGALDNEPGDCRKSSVDDHVDASKQQSHVMRRADGSLKEDGEVVDDGIATAELLEELRRRSEEHAAEMLGLAAGEESRKSTPSLVAGFDAVDNQGVLELDLLIGGLETSERRDDIDAVFVTILGDEPSGRFGKEPGANDENKTEDNLERDGKSPGKVVRPLSFVLVRAFWDKEAKLRGLVLGARLLE